MSLWHYLTIGRFKFTEKDPPPNLMQGVLNHFIPDGLKRLHRAYVVIKPFSAEEILEIEEEVQRRFGLELNLNEYMSEDGLLQIIYLASGGFESFAEHVALVASERFGAIAADKGHVFEPDEIKKMSRGLLIRDAERSRLAEIENGAERIREINEALQRPTEDPKWISLAFALKAARGASESAVTELIKALTHPNQYVRQFAGYALTEIAKRKSVKQAVPVITSLLRDPDSEIDASAVEALSKMGKEAEPGLLLALKHKGLLVRYTAIKSVGNLSQLSEKGVSMLSEIANERGEDGKAARQILRKIKKQE